METKKYGYQPHIRQPEEYIFGAGLVPEIVVRPDGQWDDFLPADDLQNKNGLETDNCSGYGTAHAVCSLLSALYGGTYDFSERFIGILANTMPPGNNPHFPAEAIRLNGVVNEPLLPFDETITTIDEYYSPKPMTTDLLAVGQAWLKLFQFFHEWVGTPTSLPTPDMMQTTLKYSPLGVAVQAWSVPDADGIYHRQGTDCHWVTCYGYVLGQYWKIFDSYDSTHKKLAWDFGFSEIKRYHVAKVTPPIQVTVPPIATSTPSDHIPSPVQPSIPTPVSVPTNWLTSLLYELALFVKDLFALIIKQ